MDAGGLGGEFRALRVAAGRTVASVAVDAGLSVPYIANLENGRGNPTIGALGRLASALGRRLVVGLANETADKPAELGEPGTRRDNSKKPATVAPTASLIRFARTQRFRGMAAAIAEAGRGGASREASSGRDATSGRDGAEFSARLIGGLAGLAGLFDRDLGEADWARLLDALFLVAADPHGGE